MDVCSVLLDSVDFNDETYRISEELEREVLRSSLAEVGQINPVLLLENGASCRRTAVCGFRRLRALRSLGAAQVAARIFPASETGSLRVFLLALWDNLAHRQLNALESARVIHTLRKKCGVEADEIVRTYLPLLGLPAHINVVRGYLKLHDLHPDLRSKLSEGRITVAAAERLAASKRDFQTGMADLLEAVRLSASLQRKVLDLIEDLAGSSRAAPEEIIGLPEIRAARDDVRLSPFQRGEKIYEVLYGMRNPRLSLARKRFADAAGGLKLPAAIRLSPDPFFESPRLRVEFDATSAERFREISRALYEASGRDALDAVFRLP